MSIILAQARDDSTVFSDSWKAYNGLVEYGFKRRYRVIHSNDEFAKKGDIRNHINGVENFGDFAKEDLLNSME